MKGKADGEVHGLRGREVRALQPDHGGGVKRRLIIANEAKVTKKQHRSPCSDCPFRRASIPGWLGLLSADEWMLLAHGEGQADCHTTKQADGAAWSCAGLAIYRANVGKLVRDPGALRLAANTEIVFSFGEFKRHHERVA